MKINRSRLLVDSGQTGDNGVGSVPFIERSDFIKILGDAVAGPLGTLAVITRRLYLFPIQFQRQVEIDGLRINVTNATAGSLCSVGIYSNRELNPVGDSPSVLLRSVDTLTTTVTGDRTATASFIFSKDTLYWIGVICNGAPTLRALTTANLNSSLGRVPNSNTAYTHLHRNLATHVLPETITESLTISTGNIPAVYILE